MKTTETNSPRSIKSWALEDRPREKLLLKGRKHLSNTELLAILLGSGSDRQSAVGLAQEILNVHNNDLRELGMTSLEALQQFRGVGPAKAITIAAALELGVRRQATPLTKRPVITCSDDAYRILLGYLMDLPHEEFVVLLLSQSNHVLGSLLIGVGGVSGTAVDVKKIFRPILSNPLVTGIILGHNHPSGNLKPSNSDIALTKKIVEASKLFDLRVCDHIIVAGNRYTSFLDKGLLT